MSKDAARLEGNRRYQAFAFLSIEGKEMRQVFLLGKNPRREEGVFLGLFRRPTSYSVLPPTKKTRKKIASLTKAS